MKLTILGCSGPYPNAGSACSGYLLSEGNTHVLLDCGSGVLANLSRYISCEELSAVILSHLHYDHMSDLLPMQYALQFHPRTAPLPIYAPATPAQLRALLDVPCYQLHPMEDLSIGDITFRFHPARHPVESYTLRAECRGRKFAYTGDTNVLDDLKLFFADADVLMADAGLSGEDWSMKSPHLSALHCAQLAQEANCAHLLLTHLNPKYTAGQLEAEARALRPDAEFVRIGKQYEI